MSKFLKKKAKKTTFDEDRPIRLPDYMYRGHWVSEHLLHMYDKERIDYTQKMGESYWVNRAEYTLASASYLRRNPPELEPEVAKLPPPEPLVYVPKVTYNICRKQRNKRIMK